MTTGRSGARPVVPQRLRDHIRPRRSLPEFVDAPTEKGARRELARIGKAYVKERRGYDEGSSKKVVFAKGLDVGEDAALKKLRRAAHALLCEPTLEAVRAAPVEVLAVAERMAHHAIRDAAFATAVGFVRGAAVAVEMMARSLDLDLEGKSFTTCVFVVRNERDEPSRWASDWLPLRHVVCAAEDAEYAKAKDVAHAFRKTLSSAKAAYLAYAFPDEPWSREDVRACMKAPPLRGYHVDLLGACDDIDIARHFLEDTPQHAFDYAMNLDEKGVLALFAEALPPLLVKPKYGPLLKSPPREVAQAVALFRTEQAAKILAPYVGHAILGPIAAAYFQDNPDLRRALGDVAKGTSKTADAAHHLLSSGANRAAGPLAPSGDVPWVLRERPWRLSSRTTPSVVLALEMNVGEERVELSDAERELRFEKESVVRDMTPEELNEWRAVIARGEFTWANYVTHYTKHVHEYLRVPKGEVLRAWNEGHAAVEGTHIEFLAVHGAAAIPGYVARDWVRGLAYTEVDDEPILEVLSHILSPRIAPVMARVVSRRKNFRRPAIGWLLRHAELAAVGLIPGALGNPGEARDDAELTLGLMAHKGAREAISRAARAYGSEAAAAIDTLLSRDPLAIAANAPKPPPFLRRADLPAVRLKNGALLAEDAMDALVEMLRVAPLDPPYPGIALIRDACDAASLGALSRELIEQWVLAGSPGRFEWMLFAAAFFPSDDGTRRVAQLAREWARKDRKKVPRACAVLAALGQAPDQDMALLHLGHVAATSRFDDARAVAQTLLDEVAATRGLASEQLEDRIVPDLDLDKSGTLELSFGARSFVVSLDEGLRPFVRGEKAFPRATKTDNATLAKAAKTRFGALKADAAAVADRQIRRFERAMVTRRAWSVPDFTQYVVGHPLLVHLARRLVWETIAANGGLTFRVGEDGGFTGSGDVPVVLGDVHVRVVHPATLREDERGKWQTVFGDYAIIQPFEQLARAVSLPAGPNRSARRIAVEVSAAPAKVLGTLESRGWRRNDRGHVTAYLRPLLSGADARLAIEPGISMEDVKGSGAQKITGVELPVPGADIDAVDYAELCRDLEALR